MYGTQEWELLTVQQSIHHQMYDFPNFLINHLNKIKSQLNPSLPCLIFCLSVTILLFIYILLVIFPYQKRFYCYTFEKEFFLTFQTISMNKLSLNFLVKIQFSFAFIKVFNYDSFNLNQIH